MSKEVIRWHVVDVVAKWRTAHGYTAKELANRAGLNAKTITSIESGQKYQSDKLEAIAAVFGIEARDLTKDIPADTHLRGLEEHASTCVEDNALTKKAG